MQCKSCGTELPKKAKICPKCGALNGKPAGNTRYLAIIGMVIMLIGGLWMVIHLRHIHLAL